jgi:hypothetical protein
MTRTSATRILDGVPYLRDVGGARACFDVPALEMPAGRFAIALHELGKGYVPKHGGVRLDLVGSRERSDGVFVVARVVRSDSFLEEGAGYRARVGIGRE